MGVLSILPGPGTVFDAAERELLEAFAVLIGAILERDRLLEGVKQAELLRMSGILQALFYAGVLLLVVMAMPQGIVGFVDTVRSWMGRRSPVVSEAPPTDGLVEGSR